MFAVSHKSYTLLKKHIFRIAGDARSNTPTLLLRLTFEDFEGYGEASMPPRYGETITTAVEFVQRVDLRSFKDPFDLEGILSYIDDVAPGNPAIKAAFDIALHDLIGQILQIPAHSLFGLPGKDLPTSKTIGIDAPEIIADRVAEAGDFKYLKIKLGSDNDEEIITTIRQFTNKPLYVDANQGWKTKEAVLDKIHWLKEKNVLLIEQPMPKESCADMEWLAARSPLPVIGDEGVQRHTDLKSASNYYHGINIKLMKSTGMREAYKMASTAKMMGLKIMLGCMSESSCAIGAACQLGALADWVDLDGNLGIKNDPFEGHAIENGIIKVNDLPGIGLRNPVWDQIRCND